jgi:hypothetical protein
LVIASVGYLNHGRGRDHSHRVQRSRSKQPFTNRLGVLNRGELDPYEHLGRIVDTAKDLVPLGDFCAPRRICVESLLPRSVRFVIVSCDRAYSRSPAASRAAGPVR